MKCMEATCLSQSFYLHIDLDLAVSKRQLGKQNKIVLKLSNSSVQTVLDKPDSFTSTKTKQRKTILNKLHVNIMNMTTY